MEKRRIRHKAGKLTVWLCLAVMLSLSMVSGASAAGKTDTQQTQPVQQESQSQDQDQRRDPEQGQKQEQEQEKEQETQDDQGELPVRSMGHCIVKLDRYLTICDGKAQTPQVLSVFYPGDPADVEGDDGKVIYRKGTSATLRPEDYTVTYWDDEGNELTEIHAIGEYTVTVTGKGRYAGSVSVLFSVFGKPQRMTLAKTSYKLYTDSEPVQLSAKADGDGSGFTWRSSNPDVAEVSEDGLVTPKQAGKAVIFVETAGNRISQPAKLRVTMVVRPTAAEQLSAKRVEADCAKISWSKVEDADAYEIQYGTKADFKKGTCYRVIRKKNTLFAELEDLRKGQAYQVRVRGLSYTRDRRGNHFTIKGSWSETSTIAAEPRSAQFADYLAYVREVRAKLFG